MSGSPKWVEAIVIGAVLAGMQSSRYRQATVEEHQRADAALRLRLQQSQHRTSELLHDAERLYEQIGMNKQYLDASTEINLENELSRIIQTLRNTTDYHRAAELGPAIEQVRYELDEAIYTNRVTIKEAEMARISKTRDRYAAEIQELDHQLETTHKSATGFDEKGYQEVRTALDKAQASLGSNDEVQHKYHLRLVKDALRYHQRAIRESKQQQAEQHRQATEQLDSIAQVIAGLKADETVMRWAAKRVGDLEKQLESEHVQVRSGNMGRLAHFEEQVKLAESEIVSQANDAQLKTDQRDYIAKSIGQVLAEMGFVAGEPVEEHPGHPASALLIHAANARGQGINVSVPVDGEVWYDVGGYALSTESKVGGGEAAVCDEAESVISEMHGALLEQFSVETSELSWEGRDPDRLLRGADDLPMSGQSKDRGSTQ